MADPVPFPYLFSPVRLGPREARNRIMRLPTNTAMAERRKPSDAMIAYHRTIARGGAGVIVTEGCAVHEASTRGDKLIALFDRDVIPALAQLAGAVQDEGALLIAQLVHGGRQHHAIRGVPRLIGPSAIACPYGGGVPHPMSDEEIEEVISSFALSALHAKEAGLAGVEIHGAQGYLIQQFLSPLSNLRDDRWGGSFENRMRFALRIIGAVRAAVGPGTIVGYRLGLEEFLPGGLTAEDGRRVASLIAATGCVDYLSLSQGSFGSIEMHLPDRHFATGAFTASHASVRPGAGSVPLVTCGRITDPALAERILADGEADMIGLSRALTADPFWPEKTRRGRPEAIRPCIACNECWAAITSGERLRCVVNPDLGAEPERLRLPPGGTPSVLVLGGGPAGLEAARIAAEAGARVTLWERNASFGGRLRTTAAMPHQGELGRLADHLERMASIAGATLRAGVVTSEEAIIAACPDLVIVATGASGGSPPLVGDGSVPCLDTNLEGLGTTSAEQPVILFDADGHNASAAIAEYLAGSGRAVILATRFFEPLRGLPSVSRIAALRELSRLGVSFISNVEPVRIEHGMVVLRDRITLLESRHPAAGLVRVGLDAPSAELVDVLRRHGIPHVVVGDAFAPRRISDALSEATMATRAMLAAWTSGEAEPLTATTA